MNNWYRGLLAVSAAAGLALAAAAAEGPRVSSAWARATAPGTDVGAAYLTIDGGAEDDRLVSASTDRAAMVHLHTVEETAGVAKMRAVDAVAVPAGKRVVLAPKGTHVMLMGLARPLVAGETFALVVSFEKAGKQTVQVEVRPADADAAGHDHH